MLIHFDNGPAKALVAHGGRNQSKIAHHAKFSMIKSQSDLTYGSRVDYR